MLPMGEAFRTLEGDAAKIHAKLIAPYSQKNLRQRLDYPN